MSTNPIEFIQVLPAHEWASWWWWDKLDLVRARTPLGGGVILEYSGHTRKAMLGQIAFLRGAGAEYELYTALDLLPVHPGVKAESLHHLHYYEAAASILESSSDARAYVLSLEIVHEFRRPAAKLHHLQGLCRSIEARNAAIDVMHELGL